MSTLTQNRVPSLNTGVYERLKGMIAGRKIEPGTRLVQQTLARQLGISARRRRRCANTWWRRSGSTWKRLEN